MFLLDLPRALQLRGERKRVQRDGMREDDDCRRAAGGSVLNSFTVPS